MAVIDFAEAVAREVQCKPRTPSTPKTAAEQMDRPKTRGHAKTLFGQPGDTTRVAYRPN
jgi:hypothetical protein